MQSLLTLKIDGKIVQEFDRNTRLPGRQRDFLDKMDEDMSQGIRLAEKYVSEPDNLQRARYVAMHLLQAFEKADQGMITAAFAYLAQRMPALNTVQIDHDSQGVNLQLKLDQE